MEAGTMQDFDQAPDATEPSAPTPPPAEPAEREISFNEAAQEPEATAEPPQAEPPEDVVDILTPKKGPKQWVIGPEGAQRAYVQRELSFIGKMQWFALVGEVLDKAMSGDDSLSINNLFSAPGNRGALRAEDFRDADTFVQAVGKLLVHAPDFLTKSYCIWLAVPDYERDLVREMMALPPDEGGLTDEQGIEIIETFIDQNYEALDRFFRDLLGRLQTRVQQRAAEAAQSSQRSRR